MSHLHLTNKRQPGQHLTLDDRKALECVYDENLKPSKKERRTQKELAEILGWSQATLSRELRRGATVQLTSNLEEYTAYSAMVAHSAAQERWTNKGPDLKIGHDHELSQTIEEMLLGEEMEHIGNLRYSPEAIVMYFDEHGWPTGTRLCARTIYNYLEKDIFYNVTLADLPRGGQQPKRRPRRTEKRIHCPERKGIHERSQENEERTEYGHWEMDCIESVRSDHTCLLTLVERKMKECLIFKIGRQTSDAVLRKLNGIERSMGTEAFREKFKSFTVDNGSEFLDWHRLETSVFGKSKRTEVYYARAYASWQRGSNENLNGFIRYFIPKKTRLKEIPSREIQELQDFLNDYPRKILEGKSAKEAVMAEVS